MESSFRTKFTEWRNQSGLTQEQVAQRLGVSVGTISRWQRGVSEPDSVRVVAALADVGIPVERKARDSLADQIDNLEERLTAIEAVLASGTGSSVRRASSPGVRREAATGDRAEAAADEVRETKARGQRTRRREQT